MLTVSTVPADNDLADLIVAIASPTFSERSARQRKFLIWTLTSKTNRLDGVFWAFFIFGELFEGEWIVATNLSYMKPASTKHLATLMEIGTALSAALSSRVAFQRVLEVLERHHGVIRGTVTVLDRQSGEIRVESSIGLVDAARSVRYRLGEGITGRVVESGKPIVVPQVSREPMFLNRAGQRKDLRKERHHFHLRAFLCQRQARRRAGRRSSLSNRTATTNRIWVAFASPQR